MIKFIKFIDIMIYILIDSMYFHRPKRLQKLIKLFSILKISLCSLSDTITEKSIFD